MKNTVSAALSRGCDSNLHEQLMSSDWLRHSTVDRRTLRPLSMVHFDPCQQPRCQARTLSSVRRTCNTQEEEEEGKKNTSDRSSAWTHDSIRRGETKGEAGGGFLR